MKRFLPLILLVCSGLYGQTAINLSGSSVSCDAGSVEVGENAVCGVYAITNNTGSDFTVLATPFVAQAYPFVWDKFTTYGANYTVLSGGHTWESLAYGNVNITPGTDGTKWADRGTAKYVTVAADGDARWRTWGEAFNPSFPSSSSFSPATFNFPSASTRNLTCYAAPHKIGPVTGHCYLVSNAGTVLSTITVAANGTQVPSSGGATLPVGCVLSGGQYDCSGVMDTTYVAPSSCSTTVSSGAALTTALAAATCGQKICVTAGSTLSGNWTLKAIPACSTETMLITSAFASLPQPGNRIGPSNASVMAKLQDITGGAVLQFADSSRYWRVVGLELTSTAPATFLAKGADHSTMYSSASMPVHNILDRVWMHTSGTTGGFGVALDGSWAVIDSYLDLEGTDETQGVNVATSNGPIVIRNNYIKAVGENVLMGGADSRVLGAVPQDMVFQGNYIYKPLTWNPFCTGSTCGSSVYDGTSRSVKNLFELKKGVRVLVDSNIVANNWVSAQDGSAILMEPANQSGSDLDVSVRDITFTNNIVHDSWQGFNHVSSSYAWPSRTSKHWTVRNNLFYNLGLSKYGVGTSYCIVNWSAGASSWFFRWNSSPTPDSDVWIQHNTCLGDNISGFFAQNVTVNAADSSAGIQVNGWNLKNNLLTHGTYGLMVNGVVGTANIGLSWNGFDNARNLFIGANTGTYNSDFVFTPDNASVKFANAATNDYRLCTASGLPVGSCTGPSPFLTAATDGTQYGADVSRINALTSCVISGQCNTSGNPTPFTLLPSTATIGVNSSIQLTASAPATFIADSGTVSSTGLFTAPATPALSTVTATKQTVLANDLNTQSNWQQCGNCGDSGGPNPQPNGTFIMTAGDPATFSAAGNYPYNNGFWWYVMLPAGAYNSTVDYVLSFDMQFPTQADKNASQAVEFELQKNVGDNQYSMAWQICFACGNKLRVFNKTAHAWEDSGLTFDPAIFAGGKWVTVLTDYHLTTGSNTRHLSISLNGVKNTVNIDHAPTPAVESDYLHPAFQLDSNSTFTPYSVRVKNFDVYTPTSTTASSQITSIANKVSPASVVLPVQGTQQFTTQQSATWTKDCGTLNVSTGTSVTFTAPATANTCTITATVAGIASSAVASVNAFTVSPSTANLTVGGTQQFTANFPATWSVPAGQGTIDATGKYTAPQVNGTYTITATAQNGGKTATASVVVSGAVTTVPLTVSPSSWSVGTQINIAITKVFTVSNIGTGSVTPTVSISGTNFTISANTCTGALSGGTGCSVTTRFISSTVGNFTGALRISDTAGGNQVLPLSVSIPTGTTVGVSPKSPIIPVSGAQTFTATVSNGAAVTWSVTPASGCGSMSGNVYTAPATPVICTVKATANDGSGSNDSATVNVQSLVVSPLAITVQTNSKSQFSANFTATWAVTSGSCTITQAGVMTAPSSNGSCVVRATAQNGGTTATASVSVVGAPTQAPGSMVVGGTVIGGSVR